MTHDCRIACTPAVLAGSHGTEDLAVKEIGNDLIVNVAYTLVVVALQDTIVRHSIVQKT